MFLAYLRGIETVRFDVQKIDEDAFLAYLRGIETGTGYHRQEVDIMVFSVPTRD